MPIVVRAHAELSYIFIENQNIWNIVQTQCLMFVLCRNHMINLIEMPKEAQSQAASHIQLTLQMLLYLYMDRCIQKMQMVI